MRGWGQELTQDVGGTQTWYLADRLGSVRGLANGSGSLTASYNYDPLGTPEGPPPGAYGFTGEPQNSTLGLVQLRARWYAPGPGRFLTIDLLGPRRVMRSAPMRICMATMIRSILGGPSPKVRPRSGEKRTSGLYGRRQRHVILSLKRHDVRCGPRSTCWQRWGAGSPGGSGGQP